VPVSTLLPLVVAGGLEVLPRGSTRTGPHQMVLGDPAPIPLPSEPPLDAYNIDLELWRQIWTVPGRLVMDFVGVARAEVTDALDVRFDRELSPDVEEHLLLDHVLPLVLAHRGAAVLHGGVVALGGRGVVLVGSSGAGKSTLTAYLGQRGWTVGGDDGAVLRAGTPATAEPTYSTLRLTFSSHALLGIRVQPRSQVVDKWRVAGVGSHALSGATVPLSLVALLSPVPAGDPATATRLRGVAAHAEVFGCTFQSSGSTEALCRLVDVVARVVDRTAVVRLDVPRGLAGLAAVEALLRQGVTQ
jgi:hypothetical protein